MLNDQIVAIEDLPPFERAQVNIDEFCASFALCQLISEIVERDVELAQMREECRKLSFDEWKTILSEQREINTKLMLIAQLNEMQFGISS
jgi:hypothetical protein